MQKNVSQIFIVRPSQWGLRGDPYLWSNFQIPYSKNDFLKEFYRMIKKFTAYNFDYSQNIFVETYNHGGMSSSTISKEFWSDTVIPLLLERLEQINSEK